MKWYNDKLAVNLIREVGSDDVVTELLDTEHDMEIAEQIVREHNAHAALVEALEQIIALEGTGKRGVPVIRRVNRMTDIAKAALALAKGA